MNKEHSRDQDPILKHCSDKSRIWMCMHDSLKPASRRRDE